jgi:hypothetical protein
MRGIGNVVVAGVVGPAGEGIANCGTDGAANAAFIVKAVNCHDELLAALVALLAEFDRYDAAMLRIGRGHCDYGRQRVNARAAIAKANA